MVTLFWIFLGLLVLGQLGWELASAIVGGIVGVAAMVLLLWVAMVVLGV